jgi:hypothetical protein
VAAVARVAPAAAKKPRSKERSKKPPPPPTRPSAPNTRPKNSTNRKKGTSGAEATELCEEEAEGHELPAESVDVSNISVEGETATAEVQVHGSALNGQTIELELANEEGRWKLNQFLAFTKFDAKALGEGVEEGLEAEGGMSASGVACFGEGVSGLSREEAEEVAFEGATEPIEGFAESCK